MPEQRYWLRRWRRVLRRYKPEITMLLPVLFLLTDHVVLSKLHCWRRFRLPRRFLRYFIVLGWICVLLSAGCVLKAGEISPATEKKNELLSIDDNDRIAAMLVGVLRQLPDFEPLFYTLQVTPPVTDFGRAIVVQLSQTGYGLQRVPEDQGSHYVSYARTDIVSNVSSIVEYSIIIQDIIVRRRFTEGKNNLVPVSAIEVIGVAPMSIDLGHDPFHTKNSTSEVARVLFASSDDGRQIAFADNREPIPGTRRNKVKNLLHLSAIDFIDLTKYTTVQEELVEFPSADIRIIGAANKQLIQALMASFSPLHDVFILSGCDRQGGSAQPTDRSLSLRTRVAQELLSSGVDKNLIRTSACAGLEAAEQGLPRSVIVTLSRRLQ